MKTKVIFLGLMAIGLLSCSGNDDKTSSFTDAALIGRWEPYTTYRTVAGQALAPILWQHDCPSAKDYIEFESDGGFQWVEYNEDCQVSEASFLEAGWSRSGNTVTFSEIDEPGPYSVTISDMELVLTTEWVSGNTRFRESRNFIKVDN